jgi:NADPH:quinone reductase-like Zn-dependent oxidoreductase
VKAAVIHGFGPPDVLAIEDVPDPVPGADEILVRVRAVRVGGLLDVGTRAGRNHFAKLTFPHILGSDFAGEVVRLGEAVAGFDVGDSVAVFPFITCLKCEACLEDRDYACRDMAMVGVHRQGSYAEYCAVPANLATRIPAGVAHEAAATLAVSGPVALTQMRVAGVAAGDWVLVGAAASGLGAVTAQVAKLLGAQVIATSRQQWKLKELEKLEVIALNSEAGDFTERVMEITAGQGVKVAVDNIASSALFSKVMQVLARGGVLVSSGALAAESVSVDMRRLYTMSQRIIGVRTLSRSSVKEFWRLSTRGIVPLIDHVFPLDRIVDAHTRVEANLNIGRVLVCP